MPRGMYRYDHDAYRTGCYELLLIRISSCFRDAFLALAATVNDGCQRYFVRADLDRGKGKLEKDVRIETLDGPVWPPITCQPLFAR